MHVNPGPPSVRNKISFCCWNIDSLLTRDRAKIGLIEGLQSVHNFDIFGICESYLTNNTDPHDLIIDGFSPTPFRSDCKDNASRPRGGVCLYFKEHLPIINRTDLSNNIDETLVCEVRLRSKKIFIVLSYRPLSLSLSNQISDYCNKLSTLMENIRSHKPAAVVLMGDFNARSPLFWNGETVETAAGKKLSDFMMLNSLEQLIDEPTHFPRDDIATCIDLIFTDQAYAISNSGVIPSPDPKCKHQLIHGNIDFCVPCPPPYKRTVWDYDKANVQKIQTDISAVNWNSLFQDKRVDDCIRLFNRAILAIFSCSIPNKTCTFNDKDAPWVTPEVKSAIRRNHRIYKKWKERGKHPTGKLHVQESQLATNDIIAKAKSTYIDRLSRKLTDPSSSPNIFWSSMRRLLNNKKITNIPPLQEGSSFVTNFPEKASIFNSFFAEQCTPPSEL